MGAQRGGAGPVQPGRRRGRGPQRGAFQTAFGSAINDDTNLAAANKTFNATNTTLEAPTFALNAAAQGRCNQADSSAFGFIAGLGLGLGP